MAKWKIFLRSKVFGNDYGPGPIAGDHEIGRRWIFQNENFNNFIKLGGVDLSKDITFVVSQEDVEVIFAVWGDGKDVLGEGHPHAYDNKWNEPYKGRSKGFYVGYVAPKGTPLPSAADIEKMRPLIREDLERMFASAVAAGKDGQSTEVFTRVLPSSPPNGPSVWDKTVAAMNSGTASPGVLEWEQGKESKFTAFEVLGPPPMAEPAARAYGHSAEPPGKKGAKQNTLEKCIIRAGKLPTGTKIAAGIGVLGLAGYAVYAMVPRDGSKKSYDQISKIGRRTEGPANKGLTMAWADRILQEKNNPGQNEVDRL